MVADCLIVVEIPGRETPALVAERRSGILMFAILCQTVAYHRIHVVLLRKKALLPSNCVRIKPQL